MALKKKPVTGMCDRLPQEMEIRDYCIGLIKETYRSFGFSPIETPCVEDINNLLSKQGGENEQLIFKIMKRGKKLKIDTAETEMDLADSGLRYDLTLPLSRYYANNANDLPSPFKALQMGPVWRADRPQRGRFRQFMQCDIDILGEKGNIAEIELITATTALLGKLHFKDFTIRINDRRLLKAMARYAGFEEETFDTFFIILDKLDKIGLSGVQAELKESGFPVEGIQKFVDLFESIDGTPESVLALKGRLDIAEDVLDGLAEIMVCADGIKEADFKILFDPTLVRGMNYYTGTIFEIAMDAFGGSVGGGGRYDEMIGKFTGQSTPACGFSIGFERIVMLLMEQGFEVPGNSEKKAYLLEKGLPRAKKLAVLKKAAQERQSGKKVSVLNMKKNKRFQKEQLEELGFTDIEECFNN